MGCVGASDGQSHLLLYPLMCNSEIAFDKMITSEVMVVKVGWVMLHGGLERFAELARGGSASKYMLLTITAT